MMMDSGAYSGKVIANLAGLLESELAEFNQDGKERQPTCTGSLAVLPSAKGMTAWLRVIGAMARILAMYQTACSPSKTETVVCVDIGIWYLASCRET